MALCFACHDEICVLAAMLLKVANQFIVAPIEGQPLYCQHIKHVRQAGVADSEYLFPDGSLIGGHLLAGLGNLLRGFSGVPLGFLVGFELLLFGLVSESRMAGKVAEQNLPTCLAVVADVAEPQEEAAECVFLAFNLRLLGEYPLGILRHVAEGGDERGVRLSVLWLRQGVPPREGNPVLGDLDVQPVGSEGFPHQAGFGIHQFPQVVDCAVGEAVPRQADRQAGVLGLLGGVIVLSGEARLHKRGEDAGIVRADNAAVFSDGDVANIVVAGGHLAVNGLIPGDFRNGGDERFARGSVQVHFRCHGLYLRKV